MSTVPEVIVAMHAGMRVLGILGDHRHVPARFAGARDRSTEFSRSRLPPSRTLTALVRGVMERLMTTAVVTPGRAFSVAAPRLARSWKKSSCAVGGGGSFRQVARPRAEAPHEFVFLRGAADGERPPWHPSRVLAHAQGSVLPASRHAGISTSRERPGGIRTGFPSRSKSRRRSGSRPKRNRSLGRRRNSMSSAERACGNTAAEWEQLECAHRILAGLRAIRTSPTRHDYIESVWWALQTLWDRGLLYPGPQDSAVLPAMRDGAFHHELALGYEDVEDPSIYRRARSHRRGSPRILVWTTTPWTLLSNAALAVHPDLAYVELRRRTGADRGR